MEDWGLICINSRVYQLERVCACIVAYKLDQPSLMEIPFLLLDCFNFAIQLHLMACLKHSKCSTPPSWKHNLVDARAWHGLCASTSCNHPSLPSHCRQRYGPSVQTAMQINGELGYNTRKPQPYRYTALS